jgi:superfamily II DNA or RNA helicase
MGNFNNPLDLEHLQKLIPLIEIRVFYPLSAQGVADFSQDPPPFHVKSFLFEKPTGQHSIIVGSSNLTGSGLSRNHEWNYFSNSETNLLLHGNRSAFQQALLEYQAYWETSSVPITAEFVAAYLPRWEKARDLRTGTAREMARSFSHSAEPRPAQLTALKALEERRKKDVRRTTVIAATGLGKTFLAAFDFKRSGLGNVLFLAHRESILLKSRDTYRTVLENRDFGDILSGSSKPICDHGSSLFTMVQTLSQIETLRGFERDAFDYIVVDEFHHAEAESYRRVLDWFEPRFLLGLTATPERMDGRDVLRLCDYDVAFESRLFDAIDNNWLVPFQYYAIHDPSDYSALRWTGHGYLDEELDQVLMHDTRAELIFTNLVKFLPATGKIKALAFCSSQNHAQYMNRKFNEMGQGSGMRSVCLLAHHSIEEREFAMARLQDESDPLQILCSVDILGEGVDIPAVSHVLFLRPTQSFTVFLQQLGRGLRPVPEKDFLVALDFVGNFRQSYVAPLALKGYTSADDFFSSRQSGAPERQLPAACHVATDTQVRRIWDEEIRKIPPRSREEMLKSVYLEMRANLGTSPGIMDFFANPAAYDPYAFLKAPKLGGNWLRVKQYMDDLTPYEKALLGTPAEALLQHLEKELSPVKSYKMVALLSLLELGGVEWQVEDIAKVFLSYYLKNKERLLDYDELSKAADPASFPLAKVAAHLKLMPLGKLAGTGSDFFELDKETGIFRIGAACRNIWAERNFQELIRDRVAFGLARYFYRKERECPLTATVGSVKVPYTKKVDTGYTELIGKVISANFGAASWKVEISGKSGYTGQMDVEILEGSYFLAWTTVRFDDITRFPARIKAAATALYTQGERGEFRIVADQTGLFIVRKGM